MEESLIKGVTVMGKRYTKHTVTNFVIPNYTTISELFEEIEGGEGALLRSGRRVIFIAGDDERFHAAIYKILDDPEEIEPEELRVIPKRPSAPSAAMLTLISTSPPSPTSASRRASRTSGKS